MRVVKDNVMKVRFAFLAATLLLLLVAACGGDDDDDDGADAGGGGGGDDGPSASDQSPGDSGPGAAEGDIVLQVDGMTLTSRISECVIGDNGSVTIVSQRSDPELGLMATLVGDAFAISVTVMVGGHVAYLASQVSSDGPTIDGQRIALTMDYGRVGEDSVDDVGVGHLNATCPTIAVADNPSGPAAPNTIQVGDRVWTRTTSNMSTSCFLQEEGQGISEGASVGDAADNDEEVRILVSLNDGDVQAEVSGTTYYWIAGSRSGGVNDLEIELDFETQTIRGSGTFVNVGRGETAQGSFEFTCES